MLRLELGRVAFPLDPAAISAIRYRAAYGRSIVTDLVACKTGNEAEGRMLRLCHQMIPTAQRPPLMDLARLTGRDPGFFQKAWEARSALLAVDEELMKSWESGNDPFDEYNVLALMTAARMDTGLIYELPIMHLVGILGRSFELQDPDRKTYRPMTQEESEILYPRPRRIEKA